MHVGIYIDTKLIIKRLGKTSQKGILKLIFHRSQDAVVNFLAHLQGVGLEGSPSVKWALISCLPCPPALQWDDS